MTSTRGYDQAACQSLAAAAPIAPRVVETEEAVDLAGVRLFMHAFCERMAQAPLRSSRFTIEPGCGTQEDRHAVYEIWFVSSGQLDVCYDGAWHRVDAGQTVFFEPWRPHFARNVGEADAQIFSVWWQ
ncbi:cupin domain-containing protein [Burkholderia ambifaria]|uniref:cupin domain-containing protein n=1 Tax=Burkholderia TaxID=32008 RepID=UPI001FC83F51|nr:cupin domain-containing protein [Burkholderia ambifaria]MDP9584445.1 quercetin dioxygenase-like cupin family protein [Burkholderia contaminans]